jgi:hypothetical protein
LPDGFKVDDNGRERRISWRWISWRAIGALVFVALWDGILALTLGGVFYGAHSFKNDPRWVPAGIAILLSLGVAMAYAVAAYLVNRTLVRLDPARVSVQHGPLPWFGTKDIPRADIVRVWSEKSGQEREEDTLFEPSVTYRVKLLLRGGKTLNLVTGLLAPEWALFIEQQIRNP